jgi:hypothetical protein
MDWPTVSFLMPIQWHEQRHPGKTALAQRQLPETSAHRQALPAAPYRQYPPQGRIHGTMNEKSLRYPWIQLLGARLVSFLKSGPLFVRDVSFENRHDHSSSPC